MGLGDSMNSGFGKAPNINKKPSGQQPSKLPGNGSGGTVLKLPNFTGVADQIISNLPGRPSGSSSSGGSSSGGSSSGGSSSGGSSGGGYAPGTNYTGSGSSGLTSEQYNSLLSQAQANSAAWHNATDKNEQARLHDANVGIYGQLGYDYDANTGKWTPGAGYYTQTMPSIGKNDYQAGYDAAQGYLNQAQQEAQRAQQAAVDANVLALGAQKDNVYKAGEQGNRAAQEAYMTVTNPNGSLAESLAARGLLSSGLTESSQVQAGNAYQGALNANQNTVMEQLSEIERAISAAKLNGDLASAQLLASYAEKVASMGMEKANAMLSFGQWATENAQNYQQQQVANSYTQQQLDMERKRLERELAAGQITQEQFDQQWQAELQAVLLGNQGLQNQNRYDKWQMQQAGVY